MTGSLPGSSKEVEVEIGHNNHDRNKCMKYYFLMMKNAWKMLKIKKKKYIYVLHIN